MLAPDMPDIVDAWRTSYRRTNPLYIEIRELNRRRLASQRKEEDAVWTKNDENRLKHYQQITEEEAIARDRLFMEAVRRVEELNAIERDDRIARLNVLGTVVTLLPPMLEA